MGFREWDVGLRVCGTGFRVQTCASLDDSVPLVNSRAADTGQSTQHNA